MYYLSIRRTMRCALSSDLPLAGTRCQCLTMSLHQGVHPRCTVFRSGALRHRAHAMHVRFNLRQGLCRAAARPCMDRKQRC